MYQIISDGSCDLSKEQIKANNLVVVPFYVCFDKIHSLKEGEDISISEFYKRMTDNPNVFPVSSCPSPNDYLEIFKKVLDEGKDIICICISTKFSGSYNSAFTAKSIIQESYPNRKITIIDSRVNTVLQGRFVLEAVRMQEKGMEYDELVNKLRIVKGSRIFFTVGDLRYLEHGGRIGKLSSLLGRALKLFPLIVLKHGEIYSAGIALRQKRAEMSIVKKIDTYFKDHKLNKNEYRFVLGYSWDIRQVMSFKAKAEEVLGVNIELSQIGATIAVHTGPNPLGIAFVRKFEYVEEEVAVPLLAKANKVPTIKCVNTPTLKEPKLN